MKVTLFGATGKTGPYLIDEALKRGFEVTVFARSSSPFKDDRVRVVRGDLSDSAVLREAVRGADAVLSALGPSKTPHPKDRPITRATQAVISAMSQENVTRLIAISTGTAVDPADGSDWKAWLPAAVIKRLVPGVYQDIVGLAAAIRSSGLDWTMVRAAFLKNRPASKSLNVGLYGRTRHSLTVSREDIAIFMFDQINSREFVGKAPAVSTRRR
ncbi:NAD(P)-dependent oxidoreductase [Agrobacterium larrymoorei]|uniref:NAD(P)H-binding protein n=1 Tax=Agrobacterium larrymoorei TaxID=160699 RepID=A0A4D7E413_9HYPH|nr:NAD(P)H-binding protein [Agrobacterium larrymoorei]QCJ00923.1 NAD-dependent epimerase/dehydratase family protein [Agrobacterium larrymoorei]QYA10257.1 NAD(P)H-binding protein [Agrobacterium larrymoorei]